MIDNEAGASTPAARPILTWGDLIAQLERAQMWVEADFVRTQVATMGAKAAGPGPTPERYRKTPPITPLPR